VIGLFQTFALLAGISGSRISMVGGLARGLSHEDAARFSFLRATPVILAAGFLKVPSLAGPAGNGIHGQVLVAAVVAGLASYVSIRWLTRWFETKTLTPFAIYSLAVGIASILRFAQPGPTSTRRLARVRLRSPTKPTLGYRTHSGTGESPASREAGIRPQGKEHNLSPRAPAVQPWRSPAGPRPRCRPETGCRPPPAADRSAARS